MPEKPTIGIRFTPEEIELLDTLAAKEERNRSDVIRRAIRAYAVAIGVSLAPKRRRSGKR